MKLIAKDKALPAKRFLRGPPHCTPKGWWPSELRRESVATKRKVGQPQVSFPSQDRSTPIVYVKCGIASHCQSTIARMLVQRGLHMLACQICQTAFPVAGRIKHFHINWSQVTQDQWVLDTIQGYRIEFTEIPVQTVWPRVGIASAHKQSLVKGGNTFPASKGSNCGDIPCGSDVTFLQPLSTPKEGWRYETSVQHRVSTSLYLPITSRWKGFIH